MIVLRLLSDAMLRFLRPKGFQSCLLQDLQDLFIDLLLKMKRSIFFCQSYQPGRLPMQYISHCLYRFLDGQKNTRFQFSISGLPGIHRNLKQKQNFNSHEGFFRKSPFCTFSCINPGFGGPQDIFSYCYFHIASKECFWPTKISNFMHGFKSAILKKLKNCQNGNFESVHEI